MYYILYLFLNIVSQIGIDIIGPFVSVDGYHYIVSIKIIFLNMSRLYPTTKK